MIRLNYDKEIVKIVKDGIKKSGGYCPCRPKHTEDTICMCKEFREQESGTCHCGLYVKENI
jgi:ferredoxin-thioredoxin reductase catalytic subunit